MGRFKVHNLKNNGHKTPSAIITSEGGASEDHVRESRDHGEPEEIKEARPKRINTMSKVFKAEVEPGEGESTDFNPKQAIPRKLPPPVISKFDEMDYSSDNLHLRGGKVVSQNREGSQMKSENPLSLAGVSQFGRVDPSNEYYTSMTSNLQTEQQGEVTPLAFPH